MKYKDLYLQLLTWKSLNSRYFSENYTEEARQVLSHANHPKLG